MDYENCNLVNIMRTDTKHFRLGTKEPQGMVRKEGFNNNVFILSASTNECLGFSVGQTTAFYTRLSNPRRARNVTLFSNIYFARSW